MSLPITVLQPDIYWEDKNANLEMLTKKIAEYARPGYIILLPEMFSTGFSMNAAALAEKMDEATVLWMKDMARTYKIILAGTTIIKEGTSPVRYYNRFIWMQPDGHFSFYDKRHLFSYSGEDKHYTPGDKRLITRVNGWKMLIQVCYDLRFPVWARQRMAHTGVPEYDVLVNVANWPQNRLPAWKTLLAARAIENQCYVIGVNRVGKDGYGQVYPGGSLIADPTGKIIKELSDKPSVLTTTLQKAPLTAIRNQYPFLKDGDKFNLLK